MDDGTAGPPPPTTSAGAGDDIADLIDRLEEVVAVGRRLPWGGSVVISEDDFLAVVDQLRVTVPAEIRQAQRLLKEREQIIGAAQDEAGKILDAARQQAEYVVSQQGVLSEARQRAEELLRDVEISHRRSLGQIDQYALEQFTKLEAAMQESLHLISGVVQEVTAELERAKRNIGQ